MLTVLSKNMTHKDLDYIWVEHFQLAEVNISRSIASNKYGHYSPAVLLGVFLHGIKKLIHQALLSVDVKFILGARDDQLCTTTKQNWKERDKNTAM